MGPLKLCLLAPLPAIAGMAGARDSISPPIMRSKSMAVRNSYPQTLIVVPGALAEWTPLCF